METLEANQHLNSVNKNDRLFLLRQTTFSFAWKNWVEKNNR